MSEEASMFVKYMQTTAQRDKIMQALEFYPQCLAGVAVAAGQDPAPLMALGGMAGTYRAITRLTTVPACLSQERFNDVFGKKSSSSSEVSAFRHLLDIGAWTCDLLFGLGEATALGARFGWLKAELGRFGSHAVYVWYWGIVLRLAAKTHDFLQLSSTDSKTQQEKKRQMKMDIASLLCWLGVALYVTNPAGPQTLQHPTSASNPVLLALHKGIVATSPKKLVAPPFVKGLFGSCAATIAFM